MYSREHERNSGKHGHSSWAAVPVSDMAETQDTRWTQLHACPSHFFFYIKKKNEGHGHVRGKKRQKKESTENEYR